MVSYTYAVGFFFFFYTYNIEDFPSFELIRNPTRVKSLMPETGTALT